MLKSACNKDVATQDLCWGFKKVSCVILHTGSLPLGKPSTCFFPTCVFPGLNLKFPMTDFYFCTSWRTLCFLFCSILNWDSLNNFQTFKWIIISPWRVLPRHSPTGSSYYKNHEVAPTLQSSYLLSFLKHLFQVTGWVYLLFTFPGAFPLYAIDPHCF